MKSKKYCIVLLSVFFIFFCASDSIWAQNMNTDNSRNRARNFQYRFMKGAAGSAISNVVNRIQAQTTCKDGDEIAENGVSCSCQYPNAIIPLLKIKDGEEQILSISYHCRLYEKSFNGLNRELEKNKSGQIYSIEPCVPNPGWCRAGIAKQDSRCPDIAPYNCNVH